MRKVKTSNSKRLFDVVEKLDVQDKSTKRQRLTQSMDLQRAKAAQSQSNIYTKLLEVRILLQRSLQADVVSLDESDRKSSIDQCNQLLTQLLSAQKMLLHPESSSNDDDEPDVDNNVHELIETRFKECEKSWQRILNRRHKDVRLHSGKATQKSFRVLDSSFWEQVEASVDYEEAQNTSTENNVFDDRKVYQQLLKEFCTLSAVSDSSSNNTAVQRRQAHNSGKKSVDRRASKGRKIRYTTIDKLVNFTFPIARPDSGSLDENAWFKSLFGGASKLK